MLTIKSSSKIQSVDLSTPGRLLDALPNGSFTSPKSPKFNELLARQKTSDELESDLEFPSRAESRITGN